MFREPTVLVLGAGASCHLGYPLGAALVNDIISLNDDYFFRELEAAGERREFFDHFRAQLRQAQPPSIDWFLENRRRFLEVGKLAIAYCIIRHERDEPLFDNGDNWYTTLANWLGNSLEELPKNRLTILTFNYDRSLDYYLVRTVQARFELDEDAAAAALKGVKIIHLYGQVGALPWQDHKDIPERPYGFTGAPGEVIAAAKGLRLIFEEHSQEGFDRARAYVGSARLTVALGFGCHPDNCQRIGFDSGFRKESTPYFSCFGLSNAQANLIHQQYAINKCGEAHWKIPALLKEFEALLRIASG